jgi:uncharacterized protein (DUF302 family)
MALNIKKVVTGKIDAVIAKLTDELKKEGFGVLTRIDMHEKFKEKLGKEVAPVVILGACNPKIAYEAYIKNSDMSALVPCNAVVRDVGGGQLSIELVKPSALLEVLGDKALAKEAEGGDLMLQRVLQNM